VAAEHLGGGAGDDDAGCGRCGGDVERAQPFEVGEPDGGGKDARELLDGVNEPELQVVGDVGRAGVVVDQRTLRGRVAGRAV
jgi:hypothetical protein